MEAQVRIAMQRGRKQWSGQHVLSCPAGCVPPPCPPPCKQDFGARDATAGEMGSNFAEKTLGNYNTDHVIK